MHFLTSLKKAGGNTHNGHLLVYRLRKFSIISTVIMGSLLNRDYRLKNGSST